MKRKEEKNRIDKLMNVKRMEEMERLMRETRYGFKVE